jgi:hypothetical protein
MSDEFRIEGNLAETTVPDLLAPLLRSRERAIFSLESCGRHDTIFVADGRIVSATTSDPDSALPELLLASGEINLTQYRAATERPVSPSRMPAVLRATGLIGGDDLQRLLERQAAVIVSAAVSARSGEYTIELCDAFPPEVADLALPTEAIVMAAIRKVEQWSLVERGVGRFDRMLAHAPNSDARVYQLELAGDEEQVYSLLAHPMTVREICERSYLADFFTCRALWALLAVNLAGEAGEEEADASRDAIASEYELEAEVERYNAAFQAIFGVVFQAIGDHVYDFIDRVVLHLAPDTMPYLGGVNLMNESRIDFDQLTNNLIAAGAIDHRGIVIDVLNELLYGWMVEIKSEFGDRFDEQIEEIVAPLR